MGEYLLRGVISEPQPPRELSMPRTAPAFPLMLALAVALVAASCTTTTPDVAGQAESPLHIEGTITAINLQPWTYDGHAVVDVETAERGIVPVQLPARWNLCKAPPVDVEALAVGMQVQVVGAAGGEGALVVCGDAAHRLLPVASAPSPAGSEGATVGGDGSAITLAPLNADDIEGTSLAGELACSFSAASGAAPLLLAKGDVASDAPSRGVVKVGSYVEPVAAPGGFDGMLRGAHFSGSGKVVVIELTGPATGDGESPPGPATLTYHRADGARRTFAGQWQCGP